MNNVIRISADGTLSFRDFYFRCALGKSGVTTQKREGDGATPAGDFPIRKILFRTDRIERLESKLPFTEMHESDGWCDDPACQKYNQLVSLPHQGSHEKLLRDDHIYDLIVVLGYNDAPAIPGNGSAIFLHIARENYTPTEGCIAISLPDALKLLAEINEETIVSIAAE
jgi:L,D-peptidoglycan transpeptidase YkuD (ErfK/YbiS/YcfS/YnhG family)